MNYTGLIGNVIIYIIIAISIFVLPVYVKTQRDLGEIFKFILFVFIFNTITLCLELRYMHKVYEQRKIRDLIIINSIYQVMGTIKEIRKEYVDWRGRSVNYDADIYYRIVVVYTNPEDGISRTVASDLYEMNPLYLPDNSEIIVYIRKNELVQPLVEIYTVA